MAHRSTPLLEMSKVLIICMESSVGVYRVGQDFHDISVSLYMKVVCFSPVRALKGWIDHDCDFQVIVSGVIYSCVSISHEDTHANEHLPHKWQELSFTLSFSSRVFQPYQPFYLQAFWKDGAAAHCTWLLIFNHIKSRLTSVKSVQKKKKKACVKSFSSSFLVSACVNPISSGWCSLLKEAGLPFGV